MSDIPSSQPPGWYYAEGDPPGTQRYWDGTQWQGGPQAVPAAGGAAAYGAAGGGQSKASPGSRFVAYLIDWGIGIGLYIVGFILIAIGSGIADALGALMLILVYVAYFAYFIYNFCYLQGTTGQTIGKKNQGIKLLNLETGQPVGAGMAFVRYLLVSIFAIPCLLDHWWILVDDDNQRLSDKVLKYNVFNA